MASKDKEKTTEESEVVEEVVQKIELVDFEKAFRHFKKNNIKAKSWDAEAVATFVSKRSSDKKMPLDKWVDFISKY